MPNARQTKFILIALALILSPTTTIADTSIAVFDLSGTVPTYFSVTTRGVPGDLDLTPNVTVTNRRIGLLHFKYNIDVATLVISSDTASGGPEATSGATYNFQGGGFQVSIDAACTSVAPAYNTPFTLTNAGVDVRSALAGALVNTGIEEDCEVLASWQGTTQRLPLAGVYKLGVTVTMTSL
jgi:hypothetical protein